MLLLLLRDFSLILATTGATDRCWAMLVDEGAKADAADATSAQISSFIVNDSAWIVMGGGSVECDEDEVSLEVGGGKDRRSEEWLFCKIGE